MANLPFADVFIVNFKKSYMMRFTQKTIVFLLLILFSISSIYAQELSMNGETMLTYKKETRPALQVILEPTPDEVKDAWEDYMKDEYDVKLKGTGLFANKDVLRAEEVTIKEVSPNAMNFYTRVIEKGKNTEMSVFAEFGYDLYISKEKYPEPYAKIKSMVDGFLNTYLPKYYQEKLEESQEIFQDLDKDVSKLSDDISDHQKEIEKLTKEMEDMESELASKQKKLKNATANLEESKTKAERIGSKLKELQ